MDNKLILFGAGKIGEKACKYYGDKVLCIADNDKKKSGQYCCGKLIISYEELAEKYKNYEICLSTKYYDEILKQLTDDGFENITFFYDDNITCEEIEDLLSKYNISDCKKIALFGTGNFAEMSINALNKVSQDYKVSFVSDFVNIRNNLMPKDEFLKIIEGMDYIIIAVPRWRDDIRDQIEELGMENKMIDLFKSKKYSFSNPKIEELKNKHNGQRCFIIGNGSSLRTEDLQLLKNEITIASHRIYKIFDDTSWRPTYYCCQDFKLIVSSCEEIEKVEAKVKLIPINVVKDYNLKFTDCTYFYLRQEEFYPNLPDFSEDASNLIYEGMTVTYANIQFAAYLGFKEIYLLGVDHSYSVTKSPDGSIVRDDRIKDYFTDDYKFEFDNVPQTGKSLLSYIKANKYANKHNIKIYNATRGGKLEVFKRVCLEDIIDL